MGSRSDIAAALRGAVEYLTEHPDGAKATDSEATATVVDGLRVSVRDAAGRTVETDMVPSVGGEDAAPSAGWLLRAAIAACDTTLIVMRAAMLDIELTDVSVTVDSESNDLGILGIDDSVPAGPLSVRTRVRVAGNADDDTLRDLVTWAIDHCPVCDATKRAVPVTVEVDVTP